MACIRNAQRLNELAMIDALAVLRPGIRQIDLSAAFLRRVFELGASAGGIDPIWQVMAPTRELGPWTLHGDLAYPTVTTDVLALVDGFGGSVVDGTVSEQSAMIRDPDSQLIELLADSWLAVLPPRP